MLSKIWTAMGLKYPSVDAALRKNRKCVRISQDGYCVRSASGFASALSHHMSRDYVTLSSNEEARAKIIERAKTLEYPCVVWFTGTSFDVLPVDDTNLEYPVQ